MYGCVPHNQQNSPAILFACSFVLVENLSKELVLFDGACERMTELSEECPELLGPDRGGGGMRSLSICLPDILSV